MNIERFAGDNKIMQQFAMQVEDNQRRMKQRQNEALQNAYEARARDVGATGVTDAGSFL
jgi:hypothetical protein